MTVNAEIVCSTTLSQVQLEHELPLLSVSIDEDEHLISEIAQQIFTTHYDKLFDIKNARSIELSDLVKQKHSLEKTWIPYLAKGSYAHCIPRYFEICTIQYVGLSCLGVGFLGSGSLTTGFGIFFTALGIALVECLVPCHPCVSNVLKSHDKILSKMSAINKQGFENIQLIKFTNVFAKFCSKWPRLIQKIEEKNQLKLFKLLGDILKEYDDSIIKILEEEFLHLAPLFLMEKVCSLSPDGELSKKWQRIKTTPTLWDPNDLWKEIKFKNPSNENYITFLKKLEKNCEITEPGKWNEWLMKKITDYNV